jgi:hypothetical protein
LIHDTEVFRIVNEGSLPAMDETLHMVGRTSGWISGQVTATCFNVSIPNTNKVLLCQDKASYPSQGGDSGSPVFRITNFPDVNDVHLVGSHHGVTGSGIFSYLGNIYLDLGEFNTPWDPCDPGFPCP